MIPTFVAGSFVKIVTPGNTRRKNIEGINDPFIRNYIKLIAELLLVKKDLKDIRITYMGGYLKEENDNTAKLYLSALNYFLEELGYESFDKSNLNIINLEEYDKDKVKGILENTDFLFLGLGDDSYFGKLLNKLSKDKINIRDIANRNNILVASSCSGSVVSSQNIYGGKYDTFYHNREPFNYPKNYETLSINPVTMETNLFKETCSDEKNNEFKDKYLLPDSYDKAFLGCKANSYIMIDDENIASIGEVYLFIDGEMILVTDTIRDITNLNKLVNEYNETKDKNLKEKIKNEISKSIDLNIFIDNFRNKEEKVVSIKKERKEYVEIKLKEEINKLVTNLDEMNTINSNIDFIEALNLKSESRREVVMKFYLVRMIKKYSKLYKNNYNEYFKDLYEIFSNLDNKEVSLYFIECFSSCYNNKDMKDMLVKLKIEPSKRVNKMNEKNSYFKKFWRYKNV